MDSFAGLLTLLFALFTCGSSKKPITCDAGQFASGQTASVTCNFPHKIKDKGHRIFVLHYPFSAPPDFSGEAVLKCRHLHRRKPVCVAEKGLQLNNVTTNHVKLRIPEVQKRFAGRYMCQIVPPDGRPMNACNLTVNGTIFTNTRADTTQPDTDSKPLNKLGLGLYAGLSVIIVTLLCIIVFLAFTIWTLKRRFLMSNQHQAQEPHPALKKVNVDDVADVHK